MAANNFSLQPAQSLAIRNSQPKRKNLFPGMHPGPLTGAHPFCFACSVKKSARWCFQFYAGGKEKAGAFSLRLFLGYMGLFCMFGGGKVLARQLDYHAG